MIAGGSAAIVTVLQILQPSTKQKVCIFERNVKIADDLFVGNYKTFRQLPKNSTSGMHSKLPGLKKKQMERINALK